MPFEKVVTLCALCKEKITVEAPYEDRNKEFYCTDCLDDIHKCQQCGSTRQAYCNDCV